MHKHKKGKHIEYKYLELQEYLTSSANIELKEQRKIFALRCEMDIIKVNFPRMGKLKNAARRNAFFSTQT